MEQITINNTKLRKVHLYWLMSIGTKFNEQQLELIPQYSNYKMGSDIGLSWYGYVPFPCIVPSIIERTGENIHRSNTKIADHLKINNITKHDCIFFTEEQYSSINLIVAQI